MTLKKLRPIRKAKQEAVMRERGYCRIKGSRTWVRRDGPIAGKARVAAEKARRGS